MKALSYLADWFDLSKPFPFKDRSTPQPRVPVAGGPQQANLAWQIATYLLVLVSIVASRFCDLYRAGALGSFRLDGPYLLFLGIVSLIAFPVVYTKATLNQDNPVFVRIALIFTAGMGWEKIVSTAIGK
jgi:hypothetical protein